MSLAGLRASAGTRGPEKEMGDTQSEEQFGGDHGWL